MAAEMVIWENLTSTLAQEDMALPLRAEELNKLQELLKMVHGALKALQMSDLNRGRMESLTTSPHQAGDVSGDLTRGRLGNLVTLLHEADDLLDEILAVTQNRGFVKETADENPGEVIRRRVLQRVVNASNRFTQEVSLFFSPTNQLVFPMLMARGVRRIRKRLENSVQELGNEFSSVELPVRQFEPVQSFTLVEQRVIGREKDRKKIIRMLLQPPRESETNVSVIPIVGLAGVGKSTLAKDVYKDKKVKDYFDLRIWVQVSQISDENEIIREIVESCTNRRSIYSDHSKPAKKPQSHSHHSDPVAFRDLFGCRSIVSGPSYISSSQNETDIFERRLRKEIDGKLYLLILDDACIKQWLRLKDLLSKGARGSRILVTTRFGDVASYLQTEPVQAYNLEGLRPKDSWSLFKAHALGQEDSKKPDLKKIGYTIAKLCEGNPLTIRVAASFLHGKVRDSWLSFQNDIMFSREREKDVMDHILHLSYSELPTRLKACFGYCSLFPDDFSFYKHDLVSMWSAQGFINPQPGQSLEDAGEEYFIELSRRCFFEDVRTDYLGNILTCKMHHIMRSLACKYTAGILSSHMTESGINQALTPTCKHVSFYYDRYSSLTTSSTLLQAQSLRTLLLVKEPDCDVMVDALMCNKLFNYKCLRVLDLHDLGIQELPASIGNLIHLRYLDLSKNDSLMILPKSVTRLYNLQTLKINSCLKLGRLPSDFGELVNLKRFELNECDSLTCMPAGLEKLTQLETLSRFVVGKDSSKDMATIGLKALKELKNLRGRLEIELTGDWTTNIHEAEQAKLSNKSYLAEVKISWEKTILDVQKLSSLPSSEEQSYHQQLLEHLQPNNDLKILCIEGYRGVDFPRWAKDDILSFLPNLVIINIEGCDKCQHLPPFGKLQFLRRLTLRHMANVQYVESDDSQEATENDGSEEAVENNDDSQEAMPTHTPFFESLEELTLHNFYKLEGWREERMVTSRQQTETRFFPRLSKLRIWNCPNLRSMPLFTHVLDLDLRNVNQILLEDCAKKASTGIRKMNRSRTIRLQIKGCHNLKSFKAVRMGLRGLPSLQQLVIERCDALISLASELRHLTSLESLEISSCKELDLSDDGRNQGGDSNSISRMSSTLLHFTLGAVSKIPWKYLTSLRHLSLREIPKMETLPEGLQHVQTLRSLWISACKSLASLPEWIGSLKALQHLRIESCRTLKKLPDGLSVLISLMKVEITECPELIERCREHTGEDWPKIKHARVLLHKTWRYGHIPELGDSQDKSNVKRLTDVKYFIVPIVAEEAIQPENLVAHLKKSDSEELRRK